MYLWKSFTRPTGPGGVAICSPAPKRVALHLALMGSSQPHPQARLREVGRKRRKSLVATLCAAASSPVFWGMGRKSSSSDALLADIPMWRLATVSYIAGLFCAWEQWSSSQVPNNHTEAWSCHIRLKRHASSA